MTNTKNPEIETSQIVSFRTEKHTLEQILKSVNCVNEESVTVNLDQSGLFFRGMDLSHVSLIDMRLSETIFQNWNVKEEIKISFNPETFLKIVKSLDKKQSVLVEIFKDEIKISNKESSTLLNRGESSDQDTPLPKIPYDQKITSTQNEFLKVLKSLVIVGDYVTIEKTFDNCYVSSKGNQGASKNELSTVFNFGTSQEISESTYSFEYLIPFLKSVPKDQIIDLEFSTSKPCRLTTKINNIGMIQFYLAPRVES